MEFDPLAPCDPTKYVIFKMIKILACLFLVLNSPGQYRELFFMPVQQKYHMVHILRH